MSRMVRVPFLALGFGLQVVPASAEDAGPVGQGARVRVTAPSVAEKRLVGKIVAKDDESLTIEVGGRRRTLSVPRSAVTKLEVSRQRSQRGRGARRGALAGAVIGGILGYASGESCSGKEFLCFSHEGMAAAGVILFAPIGAIVGAVASPGERWEPAPAGGLRVSLAPARGRGAGVSFSVGF